ncbi:MAG: metallophosphoesterase family protein [Promethearchaeota archaeon]
MRCKEITQEPELDEELLNLKLFPVLVKPNFGQPEFITPNNFTLDDDTTASNPPDYLNFEFNGLIAASKKAIIDEIAEEIDERVFIYPLGENMIGSRVERLSKIPITVKEFKPINIVPIDEKDYKGHPQNYLKTEKVYPGRDQFYFVKFRFEIPSNIFIKEEDHEEKILFREIILCDLVYDLTEERVFEVDSVDYNYSEFFTKNSPTSKSILKMSARINYHALVLSLKNWANIRMWQVTDMHIAKRNDEIPQIILDQIIKTGKNEPHKERSENSLRSEEKLVDFISKNSNTEDIKRISRRFTEKKCTIYRIPNEKHPYNSDEFFWNLPVEYRIQNFNNNLRMLIYQANEARKKEKLDFIVFTGDILDYVTPKNGESYEFKYSNWKVFLNILLGKPLKHEGKFLLKPEEITVPIFCIPGNHDYINHHFTPAPASAIYGLKTHEMALYPTSSIVSDILSLFSNVKYLRGYFQFINPDLNFAKKLGKTHLIFIDSEKNSLVDFFDFVRGSPSTKGFRDEQIEWLCNYCDKNVADDENIIVFSHAPPINPPKITITRHIIEKLYPEIKNTGEISMNLLKEHYLGKKFEDPRIDPIVNLKFGTVLNNWEEMLKFLLNCRRHGINKCVNLVLCGHEHKNLEFRLEPLEGRTLSELRYVDYFPFYKVDIPCAVYLGDYSDEYSAKIEALNLPNNQNMQYNTKKSILTKFPFILQTTSLGARSQRENSSLQCYREVIINQNHIDGFKTVPILKYFISIDKKMQ